MSPVDGFTLSPDMQTLLRMVDLLKSHGISSLFTSLQSDGDMRGTDQRLSSLMDSWIKLSDVEANGERNRILYIIKSRGSSHSNQVREYLMTDRRIQLIEAYIGPEGVLTGTARVMQEARDQTAANLRAQDIERQKREIARRRLGLERQIADLRASLEQEEQEAQKLLGEEEGRQSVRAQQKDILSARRGAAE